MMNKLKAVLQYECFTSFKYIWYFYGIQYTIIALIAAIVAISTGSLQNMGSNCLEFNTMVYAGILGVLGFKEDFKMLIQNGFTRKYIFIAALCLFAFICGITSLVDTVIGNLLHFFIPGYTSLYGAIYGYNNIFANWLWLFFFYMFICCLFYFIILVINKIGKTFSVYLGVACSCFCLLVIALFKFVFSPQLTENIVQFLLKTMGFLTNGVNAFLPLLTFLILAALFALFSYNILRRSELKI